MCLRTSAFVYGAAGDQTQAYEDLRRAVQELCQWITLPALDFYCKEEIGHLSD